MTGMNENSRILVVDDEASMRELLAIMLRREGYQVEEAGDGGVALKKLQEQGFDLRYPDAAGDRHRPAASDPRAGN
jgi:two-component system response regulator PilR (NtrC family)